MASVQKIKLSPSRDIPFNKLVLSQSNVRRVQAGVSIDELPDEIDQRLGEIAPTRWRRDAGPSAVARPVKRTN